MFLAEDAFNQESTVPFKEAKIMKTRNTFIAIVLLAVGACSLGQPRSPVPKPTVLTIILDTSWSCDRYRGDFRSLALSAAAALAPNDYLEIIVARPSRPAIKLAQTIRSGDTAELKHIEAILGNVRAQFLSDASAALALETAFGRLVATCTTKPIAAATTIVLTDGHLDDRQVQRILAVADRYRARGWSLFVTGDRKTDKDILVAANKGRLTWSLISEANPSLWLERKEDTPPSIVEENQQPEEPNRPPKEPTKIPNKSQGATPSPQPVQRTRGAELTFSGKISGVPLPLPAPDGPDGPVKEPPKTQDGSGPEPNEPSKLIEEEVPRNTPENANHPRDTVKSGEDGIEKAIHEPRQSLWARVKRLFGHIWLWLVGGICAVPLIVAGYVLVRGKSKAERIRKRLHGYLKAKKSAKDGMLIATLNGQTRRLGKLSRLRPVYVGSGAKNTLRVTEKGVGDRHLCLYQKAGRLTVQNLSKNSLTVDGVPLEPKGKRALALSSVVELTPNVKLRLSLQQASDSPAGSKTEAHKQNGPQYKRTRGVTTASQQQGETSHG